MESEKQAGISRPAELGKNVLGRGNVKCKSPWRQGGFWYIQRKPWGLLEHNTVLCVGMFAGK